MTKTRRTVLLASVATVALLATGMTGWPDMDEATTLQHAPAPEPTNPGDTFIFPPPVGTDAHDEWIEWYRNAEFDGLDVHSQDILLALHDFEVVFHPYLNHDASMEAIALLVQRDKLDNTYNPTVNEALLHNWLLEEYPAAVHHI